jgi:hypothetical protein
MRKFILSIRVLPAIVLYGLLPRSIFHLPLLFAYFAVVLFSVLSIMYMILRYRFVINELVKKHFIILDSICALAGVILACFFGYDTFLSFLFCVTAIPLFINNYKVLKKDILN